MWCETDRKVPTDVHFVITQLLLSLPTRQSLMYACIHGGIGKRFPRSSLKGFSAGNHFEME